MAKRFIDAVNLINELTTATDGTRIPDVDCDNFPVTINLRDLKSLIRKQPTTDVAEVRHGKWIYVDSDLGWREYECSVCHTYCVFDVSEKSHNFCGHCGARMDGDEDDV